MINRPLSQLALALASMTCLLTAVPGVRAADCTDTFKGQLKSVALSSVKTKFQRASLVRDEFETWDAYQARLAQLFATTNIPSDRPTILEGELIKLSTSGDETMRYDPESGKLAISSSAFDGLREPYGDCPDGRAPKERAETTYDPAQIVLQHKRTSLGSYAATNALGAVIEIQKARVDIDGLCEAVPKKEGDYLDSPFWGQGSAEPLFEIKLDPEKARTLKERGRFLVSYVPKTPFVTTSSRRTEPSFDAPYETEWTYFYLVGDMQCLALTLPDGEVVATTVLR